MSNVLVTGAPGVIFPGVSNEASRLSHPLSGVPASLLRLWGAPGVVVQVTFPPTLIVVTGVPLASSCHLIPLFLTLAVVGADGLGVAGGDVGADVGVVVAEVVDVGALVGADEVQPTNKIDAKPNARSLYIVLLFRSRRITAGIMVICFGTFTSLNLLPCSKFDSHSDLNPAT